MFRGISIGCLALLATGCAAPRARVYTPPIPATPATWSQPVAPAMTEATKLKAWWAGFHDPMLDQLVDRALDGNLDLKIASQRILQARAERDAVAAGRDPRIGISAGGLAQRSSRSVDWPHGIGRSDTETVQLEASWEPDLFGRVRAGVEAAESDVGAAQEDRRAILTSLLAEVATNYVELRAAQQRLEIAERNVARLKATFETTERLQAAGLANGASLAQARAEWRTAQAQAPAWRVRIARHAHAIAVLLGVMPGQVDSLLVAGGGSIPVAPVLPVYAPSQILRERPDIRAAERRLAASAARANVALADLFPSVRIPLGLGLSASGVGPLLSSESLVWSLAANVSQTLSDGGRRKARIAATDAVTQADALRYERSVQGAFRDVEDALAAIGQESQRQVVLGQAAADSRIAVERATRERQAGAIGYLDLLVAQRSLYAAEDAEIESRAFQALNAIRLAKALGGGWRQAYPEAGLGDAAEHGSGQAEAS